MYMWNTIEYQYRTAQDVQELLQKYNFLSIIGIILIIIILMMIIVFVVYIFPEIKRYLDLQKKKKLSNAKKFALQQIIIKKEMEDEVQKELAEEEEWKIKA